MKVVFQVTEYVMEIKNRKHISTEHGYYSHSHTNKHTRTRTRITMKHATRTCRRPKQDGPLTGVKLICKQHQAVSC